jgi:hypothetical protein
MKACFIEALAPINYRDNLERLGRGTSLTPLQAHFFEQSGRLYIKVPEGFNTEKFVCAARERGLDDAKPSVFFSVLDNAQ